MRMQFTWDSTTRCHIDWAMARFRLWMEPQSLVYSKTAAVNLMTASMTVRFMDLWELITIYPGVLQTIETTQPTHNGLQLFANSSGKSDTAAWIQYVHSCGSISFLACFPFSICTRSYICIQYASFPVVVSLIILNMFPFQYLYKELYLYLILTFVTVPCHP